MNTTETKHAQHTPGPWHTSTADEGGKTTVRGPSGEIVATASRQRNVTGCASYGASTAESNGMLIAAAPELLEACKLIMQGEHMQAGKRDGATMGKISSAIDAARAAIAKATGGAS